MTKMRMSIDDIHAMVGSIRANVVNMRVTNIYDISQGQSENSTAKLYLLKLHQPPYPKRFLLLESGIRFHTSKYTRLIKASDEALPSQFTMKLRKHLRGKRLSALTQLEGDRVVDFTFGQGETTFHLILELYALGNIILTDNKYQILSLLRTHRFDENVVMAVKQVYPVQLLGDQEDKDNGIQTIGQLQEFVNKWFEGQEAKIATLPPSGKTQKKKKVQTIKQILLVKESTFGGLGPAIIEHCLVRADISPTLKIKSAAEFTAIGEDKLTTLLIEIKKGWKLLERLRDEQTSVNGPVPVQTDERPSDVKENDTDYNATPATKTDSFAVTQKCGFIILKDVAKECDPEQFEEFTPFLYAQHLHKKCKSFDTFDEAVDEYFSRFEAQLAVVAKQSAQLAAENKLAKLKKTQQQQLAQLRKVQEKSFQHAQLIEANQQDVENVLLVIRSALASGMDWRGLEELVRYEQKNGNPVASLIHQLDLEHNRVSLLLCDEDDEGDDGGDSTGEEDKPAHVIWIDLSLSALANAREIYTKKKKASAKVVKTTEATDKAIALAKKNTKQALEKQQTKRNVIYQRRKTLWFEKFHWFLSNERYLVIAGKDTRQNELLVNHYLRKGDVYVHADLHGAALCIVRNHAVVKGEKTQDLPPIPVATLEQAGCMSVCRSSAWNNHMITGAYWVHADQVLKKASTGTSLTTGSFAIHGKKNFIQPSRLEMGLAILFRIDESCVSNHAQQSEGSARLVANGSDQEDVDEVHDVSRIEKAQSHHEEEDTITKTMDDMLSSAHVRQGSSIARPVEANGHDDGVIEADVSAQQPQRDGKKRLSVKERRDRKKGKVPVDKGCNDDDKQSFEQEGRVEDKDAGERNDKKTVQALQPKKHVRGKKGKMKKMLKKYMDQDDEDRRLRMEALGHVVGSSGGKKEDKKKDLVEQSMDDTDKSIVASVVRTEANDEFIRQQRKQKERFLEQQEDEADGLQFFNAFVGEPLSSDIVLFAMPMCAPYASLTKYKYKIKLTPGSQKKGKAAKQAMGYFLGLNVKEDKDLMKTKGHGEAEEEDKKDVKMIQAIGRQREVMQCIEESEVVSCIIGPVFMSAPGLNGSNSNKHKKRSSGKSKKK